MKRIGLMLCILMTISLACEVPLLSAGGDTRSASETPSATGVLFQDDFSGSSSNTWIMGTDARSVQSIEDGVFQILIDTPDVLVWSPASQNFEDIRIDVDAEKIDGPEDAEYGVICRYTRDEEGNFSYYYFVVTGDGHAKIAKVINSEQSAISGVDFRFDQVNKGNASNRISAECIGNQLTLYIDNSEILVVADNTLSEGDVGVIVTTYAQGGMRVHFDNFVVTKR